METPQLLIDGATMRSSIEKLRAKRYLSGTLRIISALAIGLWWQRHHNASEHIGVCLFSRTETGRSVQTCYFAPRSG